MNVICVIGNVTRDPELHKSKESTQYVSFDVAVDRIRNGVDYIPCIAFGRYANVIQERIKKGNRVGITGYLHTGRYRNKNNEIVRTFAIFVTKFFFCENKLSRSDSNESSDLPAKDDSFPDFGNFDEMESELPFT